jgi:hypothetical protein
MIAEAMHCAPNRPDRGHLTTVRPSLDFESHFALLRTWAIQGHRPNLLVVVEPRLSAEAVARRVITLGVLPFHWSSLPGRLSFPPTKEGTLFLNDVAALRRDQQLALQDWLDVDAVDVQVISLTSLPLERLVAEGQFLESLYYRLNVVRLDVTRHGR